MRRRNLLQDLGGGAAALAGALAAARAAQAGQASPCGAETHSVAAAPALPCHGGRRGPRDGYFPDAVVLTHEGERARFYTDLVMGRTVVFNFMYTQCGERCPLFMANLVKVQRLLGERVGRDIFMYSLTLDPLVDTPRVLRGYADALGVGPGWRLLTGAPADMELLRQRLGFVNTDPELDRDRASHLGLVRYGNERLDRWSACAALSDPAAIVRYISWMEPHPAAVSTQEG